ncbi:MAG: DUF4838 domain-containing protein, partial [Proteobacteria bacterium]|nr:DUF4838 domain-containing protein [Pseudomonadota bacterium]
MRNYSLQKKTPQDPSNYANIIFLDPTLGTDFVQEEVADEFARFLNHLTGQSFTIIQNQTLPSSGIMILKINSPAIKEAPQPVKDQFIKFKKGEKNSFLIFSDGTSRLWILAKTQEGLRHGMYYFLEKKGMRWYFPTDHWIISPQGISLASTINEFREPDFGRTNFEGVGGLEVLAPFPDPDKTHMPRKLWERWKKRNQWPAKPNLGGHTSNFNLCTQDINTDSFEGNIGELLRSDPLNLAQINGIRQRLPSAGFCTDGACIQKLAYTYHGQVSCENKKIPAMISYKGTLDRSGTQSHGQVLDAELQQTGGMDNSTCYGFNRRNGIIAKIGDLNNDSPFIICAWIKPNFSIHNRQKQFLFGFYGHNFREPAELSEFVIYHQPGTNMVCVNHGSTFSNGNPDTCKEMSSTPMIAPGQWTHVLARKWYTATNDRTYVELYVNDQLQRTIWHEGNIKIKPNVHKIHDFWIGGKNDITNGFSGDIDDVMVYNGTAWTREDIRHIYERDTGYREQDRILYLDFEENYQLCENPTDYQSYGGIVRLYTEWAKSRYRHFRFDMNNPNYTVQTIEPPDGRGHDTSLKSKNLLRFGPYGKYLTSAQQQQNSTISDRIFHFANEVTRHFKSAYPEADTSLLAYNEHAQVPSIPINANILVFIAPNAFHHRFTGKTSKQLMDAWHEKSRHNPYGRFDIGIYDYWSCADNIPRIPLSITNRIREWETRHFELFHLETAFSCGAVGLHLYLASKFVWDATMDDTRRDALIEEFYQKAFGPAQKPMARLLNRWYSGHFFLCEHELGVSYDDLIAAGKLARKAADVNLQKRINDFKLFLHFLRLVYENRFSNISRKQQLATHMWKMFDSLMVNSKDLCSNLYSETPNWETHPGYPFDAYYNLEIDDLIRDGDALYEPIPGLETARRSFSKDLIPLEAHM